MMSLCLDIFKLEELDLDFFIGRSFNSKPVCSMKITAVWLRVNGKSKYLELLMTNIRKAYSSKKQIEALDFTGIEEFMRAARAFLSPLAVKKLKVPQSLEPAVQLLSI